MADWDPTPWNAAASFQTAMFYVLYDFTDGKTTLASIHLPPAGDDDGPVLIKVTPETYEQTVSDLREMCINEGDEWMTTMLIRPEHTMHNTSDLEPLIPYILVAHITLVQKDPSGFVEKLKSMKRWLPN